MESTQRSFRYLIPSEDIPIKHKTIFINNLSNAVNVIVMAFLSFLMTPFYLKTLGILLYGIWNIVQSIVTYASMMDLGVQSAVQKYIAEYLEKNNLDEIHKTISSALLFYILVTSLVGITIICLLWNHLTYFNIGADYISVTRTILILMTVDLMIVLPGTVWCGVLTGAYLFYVVNFIFVVFNILKAITIYFFMVQGYGIVSMAVTSLGGDFFQFSLLFGLVQRKYKLFSFKKFTINWTNFRLILSFGIKTFLIIVSSTIKIRSDSLLVGHYLSPAGIPAYVIPANLVYYARQMLLSITQSFLPLFSKLDAGSKDHQIREIILLYSRYTCLCIFPLVAILFIFGEPFLAIWVGQEISQNGGIIVSILSLSVFILSLNPLGPLYLIGTAKQQIIVSAGFVSMFLFLGSGILLIRPLGTLGIALAFLLAEACQTIMIFKKTKELMNLSLIVFFRQSLIKPLIILLLITIVFQVLKINYYPRKFWVLSVEIGLGLSVTILFTYLIGLSQEERKIICRKYKNLIGKYSIV
ncbi:MAG: oligosaccharide flippase family protein [Pseudomonadota bacterium]